VVLDEAHNLEDAATTHLGANITRRGLLRIVGRLERRGRGVLAAVEARLRAGDDDLLRQDALELIARTLRPGTELARERANVLYDLLADLVARHTDGVIRLQEDFAAEVDWIDGPAVALEGLLIALDTLSRGIARLREVIQIDRRWTEALQEQLVELHGAEGRVRESAAGLRLAFQPRDEPVPMVRWLERRGVGQREGKRSWAPPDVAACAAPVDLSGLLRESLLEQVDSAVLTSATLSTRDGFSFIRRRLGIGGGLRVVEASYPSPFDFETQAMVAVATDLPGPRGDSAASFDRATAAVVEDLARLSDGGIFVLFTSYRALRGVAGDLRRRGVEGRWPLFVQGEAPRGRILERFTASGRGLLLGVSSFWEGVDVPGEPLRGLVIAKLPFKVPTEPLTAARLEAIERNGGNGFAELMLPQAALRLKQGFGRLIRSRGDRGAVVLLDRRLRERGYGRYFLDALPPAPVFSGPWAELVPRLRAFYTGAPAEALEKLIPEIVP
jgi:ATP-dependent DNA helicase DinG